MLSRGVPLPPSLHRNNGFPEDSEADGHRGHRGRRHTLRPITAGGLQEDTGELEDPRERSTAATPMPPLGHPYRPLKNKSRLLRSGSLGLMSMVNNTGL